jgi:hypothetical protein
MKNRGAVFSVRGTCLEDVREYGNGKNWDPRETALSRASNIYKRQTYPLVRKDAPQKQDRNCQTVINIW